MPFKEKLKKLKDKTENLFKAAFAPDLSGGYEGKDGVERNAWKLRITYRAFKTEMAPFWNEFKCKPNGHNFTDLFVESARHHAYFVGHVYAVAIPILVVSVPTLIALLALERM
jgi:hypothetical protein